MLVRGITISCWTTLAEASPSQDLNLGYRWESGELDSSDVAAILTYGEEKWSHDRDYYTHRFEEEHCRLPEEDRQIYYHRALADINFLILLGQDPKEFGYFLYEEGNELI